MKLTKKLLAGLLTAIALHTQAGTITMTNDTTLKFASHNLNIQVYSASDVYLVYAGTPHTLAKGTLAAAKTERDNNRYPNFKSGTYPTFAGLVEVKWRAADGSQLQTTLDFDQIFKDRKVLHQDDASRIYKNDPTYGDPTLIVEVNDRTLNVYMFVTLRLEKGADIEHHEWRTLAYSNTY